MIYTYIRILVEHGYILLCSLIPLGILYPFTTTSSDDSFPTNGRRGYNLSVSLMHNVT